MEGDAHVRGERERDDTHLCSCSEREEDAICLAVPVSILEGIQHNRPPEHPRMDEIPLKALITENMQRMRCFKVVVIVNRVSPVSLKQLEVWKKKR